MDIVARQLRQQHGLLVVHCSWFNLPLPQEVHAAFSAHEHRFGVHAGEVETSMLLHFGPEQVQMARRKILPPPRPSRAQRFAILGNGKSAKLGWAMQDYNPPGQRAMPPRPMPSAGRRWSKLRAQGLAQLFKKCTNCRWIPWARRIRTCSLAAVGPSCAIRSRVEVIHRHPSRPALRWRSCWASCLPSPRPIGQSCAPNRPSAEHAVLIQSDQGPDRGRIELLQQ